MGIVEFTTVVGRAVTVHGRDKMTLSLTILVMY